LIKVKFTREGEKVRHDDSSNYDVRLDLNQVSSSTIKTMDEILQAKKDYKSDS